MPYIRITQASSDKYWYRFAIGKVVYAYTIETGKAVIRNDDVKELLNTIWGLPDDLRQADFKGYVFEGDYEVGELVDSWEQIFYPLDTD